MEELIRQCQQGDRVSMGRLYTLMHDELLTHCRRYAADDNTAEDLLHDAFLLIFSHIDKVHSPDKGRRWMHKVVRNVCLLYMQHRQSRTLLSIDDVRETAHGAEPEPPVSYDDILRAVDQLPQGYRQVFRLSVLEGLTHQQIADLLGIEPHTSSSQLLRAKRQLRQLLQMLMLATLLALPFGVYHFLRQHREAQPATRQSASDSKLVTVMKANGPVAKADEQETTNEAPSKLKDEPETTNQAPSKLKDEPETTNEAPSKKKDEPETTNLAATKKTLPHLTLSLAYNGLPNAAARQLPYGAAGMNGDIDSVTHHRMPVTLALHARYRLGAHWWGDGGLHYTLLSSETRVGNTYLNMNRQQHVRYLGLSVGVGVGLEYNLTPAVGFFAEPSLQYYFHQADDISTWRTDHPFTPALPIGIRLSF